MMQAKQIGLKQIPNQLPQLLGHLQHTANPVSSEVWARQELCEFVTSAVVDPPVVHDSAYSALASVLRQCPHPDSLMIGPAIQLLLAAARTVAAQPQQPGAADIATTMCSVASKASSWQTDLDQLSSIIEAVVSDTKALVTFLACVLHNELRLCLINAFISGQPGYMAQEKSFHLVPLQLPGLPRSLHMLIETDQQQLHNSSNSLLQNQKRTAWEILAGYSAFSAARTLCSNTVDPEATKALPSLILKLEALMPKLNSETGQQLVSVALVLYKSLQGGAQHDQQTDLDQIVHSISDHHCVDSDSKIALNLALAENTAEQRLVHPVNTAASSPNRDLALQLAQESAKTRQ